MSNESTGLAQRPLGAAAYIEVRSHHIRVSNFNRKVKEALLEYCRGIAQYGMKKVRGRFVKAMTRVYVGVTHDRNIFHFHVNQLDDLLRHLSHYGVNSSSIHIDYKPVLPPKQVEYNYIEKRTPRDYQAPQIAYGIADGPTKVITARPGRGKTFMALAIINALKVRTFFVIKPMYIEKWIKDAQEAFKFKPGELMTVRGNAQLKTLISLGLSGQLDAKIVLCSNATFYNYLKDYERHPNHLKELGYECNPDEFYERLGFGMRAIDEVHQDFHLNYRQDLYAHVWRTLSLSGTLESDDRFVESMYDIMFPKEQRSPPMDDTSHVMVRALMYKFPDVDKRIRYTNKALKSYSHILFEESIMKNKGYLKDYVDMISDVVMKSFISVREDGQKMIVYCGRVELCTLVSQRLAKLHPTLNVTRYVSEDDYDEMLECDLIVSTLKSLGTAIDIPGLRTILMTDAVSSRQANLQAVERLRPLDQKWPGTRPEFYYLVCQDIDKHRDYHDHKQNVFRGRVVEHKEFFTRYSIGA